MKKILFLLTAASITAFSAHAETEAKVLPAPAVKNLRLSGAGNCTMQENVSLNITFNIRADSFTDAKKKFDEKIQQVENFARQQEIKKFDLQSMNYNVNAQMNYNNGVPDVTGYQLNGNAGYQIDSADNAFKLGEFLTQQKLQVGVNVNKYRNGVCNTTAVE